MKLKSHRVKKHIQHSSEYWWFEYREHSSDQLVSVVVLYVRLTYLCVPLWPKKKIIFVFLATFAETTSNI